MKKRRIFEAVILILFLVVTYFYSLERKENTKKEDVLIAVLDTGYSGEDGRVLDGISVIEYADSVADGNGHGTKIVQMILEATDENVKVLPIKIADDTGRAVETDLYQGIKYAIEKKADIIHLSLNRTGTGKEDEMVTQINRAIEMGIEVVVSAGNSGKDVKQVFPANIENAVVVSAVDRNDKICRYSNYGRTVDFAAYGNYMGESGTSYAAARVTAMLAEEYGKGGDLQTLQCRAIDAGESGKDEYYGYGILKDEGWYSDSENEKIYLRKSQNDLGYRILDIDWHEVDAEVLDKYFVETHSAYVGMYLWKMNEQELSELKKKSSILNSDVLVQDFKYDEREKKYVEEAAYEENFAEHAIKEYLEHEQELTISAEWLILKDNGYFAVSSENRDDIFYFQIGGFFYKTNTPDSQWFGMFKPEKLSVTRTIVKQTTAFGVVSVAGFEKYLCSGNCFAYEYTNPETGESWRADNFFAIDAGTDKGGLNYGLSIIIEGYSNYREGYHTGEEDIVQIPYDYKHAHEKYSYETYKEPLKYYFFNYSASANTIEYATTPQRVENQQKNFKKLITVDQLQWYNGVYKSGYNYTKVDESLSLEEKLSKYLKSYSSRTVTGVNIYAQESSLHENGFSINADIMSSLGIQWNNGETSTIAVQNDIPEYHFPLVINQYELVYNGNGATAGGMEGMTLEYNQEVNLAENRYSRQGYVFVGWSKTSDGEVEYTDKQAVCNLAIEHGAVVVLYAVWDEYPWILAEDLYFTLEEAQQGGITYEKLMSHAKACDREAGGTIMPGIDEEKGTEFLILDYRATDYTELLQEDSIPLTYRVTDSVGNVYEKQIVVHIVDSAPKEETIKGSTRFISEKYYLESYENGGLEENSVWLLEPEYVSVILETFKNSKRDGSLFCFSLTYEEISAMKEFIRQNGIENIRNPEMLQMFYEMFLSKS